MRGVHICFVLRHNLDVDVNIIYKYETNNYDNSRRVTNAAILKQKHKTVWMLELTDSSLSANLLNPDWCSDDITFFQMNLVHFKPSPRAVVDEVPESLEQKYKYLTTKGLGKLKVRYLKVKVQVLC